MRISPFQLYESEDVTGLVTENHLGYRFGIEPQQASKVATMIHAANNGANISEYLNRFPIKYLDSPDEFRWSIVGNGDKNIPLAKAEVTLGSTLSATDQAGLNYGEFYLYFNEAYFTDVNQIVGEQLETYPIRILEDPVNVGGQYRYRCKLNTGDPNLFIPYEELLAGKRFSKDFSPVEQTLSKKGGGVHYTFPYEMANDFSMIRMEDTVPGNMINRPVKFSWVGVGKNGKQNLMTTWMDYRSYEFERQFQNEINHLLMYATTNKTTDGGWVQKGKSGYELKMGAGIKQQMYASNYYTYNTFDIKKFTETLLDLSVGKIVMGMREVSVLTGEWGMYQFSEALEDYSQLYTPARDNTRIYKGSGNTYGFRGQFLEYDGPNGVKVRVIHDSSKDNIARNKVRIPGKQGLAESYVYDILSMGSDTGEANIQKVLLKNGGEVRGYIPGLRNPFNADNKMNPMATSVDGWTEHRAFIGGAMVKDPTRTAVYRPIAI